VSPLRTRLLFLALVVGQLFLVAGQVRDPRGAASLLEGAWLRVLAPVARLVAATGDAVGGARQSLATRGELEEENRGLRAEVGELRRERLRLSGLALEADELARGAGLVAPTGFVLRAARVVYLDRRSGWSSLVLEVGARGARIDQAVVAEAGLVGRVIEPAGPWAKVQLITDRAAAVGVLLEAARRQGILRGAGAGRLEIDYVPLQTEVAVGDRVVTAGIDGVYPRGLPVGVVTEVGAGNEIFHHLGVTPAVDFDNLSLVYLLDGARPPAALVGGAGDAVR
jgi:rod shape-determining protein MreC